MSKKLKFHYIYDDNYSPDYISGIHSSVSPQNELELNFFLERAALPKSETFSLTNEGKLSDSPEEVSPKEHHNKINIVRHIKNGIIIDKAGAELLLKQINEYLSIIK